MAENALSTFLSYGTELITWLVQSAITMIEKLMTNPVTACFLIIGLVSFVFVTYRMITRR